MRTSTFETLIDLNDRGVDLLTSRNVESANMHFRTAIRMLEAVLKQTSIAKAPCRNLTSAKREAASAATDASPQQSRPAQGAASLSSTLDQSRFYVSMRPIKIVPKNRSNKEILGGFATTVISYNLALSFHLLSLKSSVTAYSYRRSAIAFYRVAFTLCLKAAKRSSAPSGTMAGTMVLLDLAITNNLAVLHHQTGNEEHARNYFERLVFQIRKLDARLTTKATGFVANLIVMDLSGRSLPAAAAAWLAQ